MSSKQVVIEGKAYILQSLGGESKGSDDKTQIMEVGKCYLVRTVTHYQIGRFVGFVEAGSSTYAVLEDASWIADTGRFNEALMNGKEVLKQVEYIGSAVRVNMNAGIDIWPWNHELPNETK